MPITVAEADSQAIKLLHAIVLGPDDLLDDAMECARKLLARPINP